jgi:murein DD-endopeptidase MepM/ murein hydrolase activator NlpD
MLSVRYRRIAQVIPLALSVALACLVAVGIAAAATGTYTVQKGDTLYRIAKAHGLSVEELAALNNLTDVGLIHPGQELVVQHAGSGQDAAQMGQLPPTYVVQAGDTIWAIGRKTGVHPTELLRINGLQVESIVHPGLVLYLAEAPLSPRPEPCTTGDAGGSCAPLPAAPGADRADEAPTSLPATIGGLAWPVMGLVSSTYGGRWGRSHQGIDLSAPVGTPVQAAADGVVVFVGTLNSYGLLVVISHGEGWESWYAHNSQVRAQVGESVRRGQSIASVGSSGNATGPHLHFEVRHNGIPLDPLDFLQ